MFGKKKKPFNPYESRADDLIYEVWEERDRLYEKTRQVITRVGVINLYPDCPDRKKAVSDAEEAKHALIVAIGAYDTARMEYAETCISGLTLKQQKSITRSFLSE